MDAHDLNGGVEMLYSEEIAAPIAGYAIHHADQKKPNINAGFAKKFSRYVVPLATAAGLLFSPPEARAQQGEGIISIKFCPPNSVPSEPFYYKLFLTKQGDPAPTREVNVPSSVQRYNFTGLDAGVVYEATARTCVPNITQPSGEICSVDSANHPLIVAALYGNTRVLLAGSENVVNIFDLLLCIAAVRGTDTSPDVMQACDRNGDLKVDYNDIAMIMKQWGRVQPNPLGTSYVDCTTPFEGGPRCPETGSCDPIPYGPRSGVSFVAPPNAESILEKLPDGNGKYRLVPVRAGNSSSASSRKSTSELAWSENPPWGNFRKGNKYGGSSKLSRVFNFNNAPPHLNYYR